MAQRGRSRRPLKMSTHPDLRSVSILLEKLGTTRAKYFGFVRHHGGIPYTVFEIPGKRGKVRKISVPDPYIKALQTKLASLLSEIYRSPAANHGFVVNKSIVTNARMHRRQRLVLNLDLADFFPTITTARIAALLTSARYEVPRDVAKFISILTTNEGSLPQGAPTSPILSNMIASRLDSKLSRLAKESKCIYTRYADDITFSTSMKSFPDAIVEQSAPVIIGKKLTEIIQSERFELNQSKTRIASKYVCQRVTGIVVNRSPNVKRRRVDEVRAILHDWAVRGEEVANERFLGKRNRTTGGAYSMRRYVSGQIAFISMVRGVNDPVVVRLRHEYQRRLDPMFAVSSQDYLKIAFNQLDNLEREADPQKAGYLLEQAFLSLARADTISLSGSFRKLDGAIQVDGAITVDGQDYFVECKWTKTVIGSADVQTLIGKLTLAPGGTRGILISKSGFTDDAIRVADNTKLGVIFLEYSQFRDELVSAGGLANLVRLKWTQVVRS